MKSRTSCTGDLDLIFKNLVENIGKESDRHQNSIDVPCRRTDINYCSILSQTYHFFHTPSQAKTWINLLYLNFLSYLLTLLVILTLTFMLVITFCLPPTEQLPYLLKLHFTQSFGQNVCLLLTCINSFYFNVIRFQMGSKPMQFYGKEFSPASASSRL